MSVRQILRNVVLIVTRTRQFIKSNILTDHSTQIKHFRCEQIRERGGARKKDWEKVRKAEKRVCLIFYQKGRTNPVEIGGRGEEGGGKEQQLMRRME